MNATSQFADFSTRLAERIDSWSRPESSGQRDGFAEAIFNELALELFAFQFASVPVYRRFCRERGASPGRITTWEDIPPIPVSAFKAAEVTSVPPSQCVAVFHSSGTTGQIPSRHFHSHESLALYECSLRAAFRTAVLPDRTCDTGSASVRPLFLMLTPSAEAVPHSSLAHMFETVRRAFAADDSLFLASADPNTGWRIDFDRTLAALRSAVAAPRPAVVLGTAFSFVQFIDECARRGLRHPLPPGSRVMETGGYKGRSRSIPKNELHALLAAHFHVPDSHIISEYGMSELGSQAYDRRIPTESAKVAREQTEASAPSRASSRRLYQFPPWVRSRVVSPETLRPVDPGRSGLLQIYDLTNVASVLALQTEDLAVQLDGGFELLGRAPAAEPRGCSLAVADAD